MISLHVEGNRLQRKVTDDSRDYDSCNFNMFLGYERKHLVIVDDKHPLMRLIARTEHLRLLHAGPTLLAASLSQRYHIVRGRYVVRSVTRSCVTCHRSSTKPQPPLMGQLPIEHITPDAVFSRAGLDYAGPVLVKYGSVRKPTVAKAYICVFVSLSIKVVHLVLVSDLTTETFIAALRHYIGRRGKPGCCGATMAATS